MIAVLLLALLSGPSAPGDEALARVGAAWSLYRGLYACGELELQSDDQDLVALLGARVGAFGVTLPFETTVRDEVRSAAPPRIVFARVGSPALSEFAAFLPLTFESGGFRFQERTFDGLRDAFSLTLADPEAPDRPLTIVAGNARAPLLPLFDLRQPPWRPRLSIWRDGLLVHDSNASVDGRREEALDALAWPVSAEASSAALVVRVDPALEGSIASRHVSELQLAQRRVLEWFGCRPESPVPVWLASEPAIVRAPPGRLARPTDGEDGVLSLAGEGLPAAGGSSLALVSALACAGEPAQLWLRDAIGVAASDSWWGRGLAEWTGHLARAGLGMSVAELVQPSSNGRHSVHRLAPLRALLLQHLIEMHGAQRVRQLWQDGLSSEECAGLERAFAMRLTAAASALPEPAPRFRPDHKWRGVALTWSASGAMPSRAEFSTAIEEARSSGADALSVSVFVPLEQAPSGRSGGSIGSGSVPDALLATVFAEAGGLGMRRALVLHTIAAPASTGADGVARTLPDAWKALFDSYCANALHSALTAELLGCELLCFGVNLPWACDVKSEAGNPRKREVKREGWERLLPMLRGAFHGGLTYAAGNAQALEQVPFLEELDVLGVLHYPRMSIEGELAAQKLDRRLESTFASLHEPFRRWQKPILMVQAGFPSAQGAWARTDVPRPVPDAEVQRLLYEGLAGALARAAWNEPWFAGLFLWSWPVHVPALPDWGFGPRAKPAAELVPALFGK